MRTRNISVSDDYVPTINLGRQGENEVSQVVFDVSELITDYGSGTAVVVVRRPTEITTYQHDDTVQSGDTVTWTVSSVDTEIDGNGNVQLFWMVNDAVAKTITYQTYVEPALMNPTDAPVSEGGWISEEIGDLSELETTDRTNLVAAINEVAQNGGSGGGSGLTNEEKSLILTLFSKAAYADDDASEAYEELSSLWGGYSVTWSGSGFAHSNNATSIEKGQTFTSTVTASTGFTISTVAVTMGGNTVQGAWSNGTVNIPNVTGNIVITVTTVQATVSSISAVYTQSGTVYDTDSLDNLKNDLIVTATYADSSTYVVPAAEYTLSGTLVTGTSTITVNYAGKTATFNVTVTHVVTEEVLVFGTCSTATGKGMKFNGTTFEDVSASNEWLVASTIKASTLSFTWNTSEANAFQVAIGQYDESGTPYKVSNTNRYSSNPLTDGSSMTWANPKDYYYTAIGGGNIQITLPTSGVVKIVVRRSSATGTDADSNSAFASWLENDGLTITAHI